MGWKKKADPKQPATPAFHHPRRCLNCGHLDEPDTERGIDERHEDGVGCMVEGGTKYLHDEETGAELRACSCEQFVPAEE